MFILTPQPNLFPQSLARVLYNLDLLDASDEKIILSTLLFLTKSNIPLETILSTSAALPVPVTFTNPKLPFPFSADLLANPKSNS